MCASTPDKSSVEVLVAPEGAKVGERVVVEGLVAEPAKPTAMTKKKILEKVLPDCVVDDNLRATYKGKPFVTSAGPVLTPTLKGGQVG